MRTDEELLLAAGKGDRDAFAPLVERHHAAIVRFVHRYLATTDCATAEDLAQDIFLGAWKYAPAFRGDARAFTWLFRIAVNTCLNFRRRSRSRGDRPLPLEKAREQPDISADASGSSHDAHERSERVRRAIAKLPPKQRAAIVLRHYHDLSRAEIMDIIGASGKAVDALLHRGRESLRTSLRREISEE